MPRPASSRAGGAHAGLRDALREHLVARLARRRPVADGGDGRRFVAPYARQIDALDAGRPVEVDEMSLAAACNAAGLRLPDDGGRRWRIDAAGRVQRVR